MYAVPTHNGREVVVAAVWHRDVYLDLGSVPEKCRLAPDFEQPTEPRAGRPRASPQIIRAQEVCKGGSPRWICAAKNKSDIGIEFGQCFLFLPHEEAVYKRPESPGEIRFRCSFYSALNHTEQFVC